MKNERNAGFLIRLVAYWIDRTLILFPFYIVGLYLIQISVSRNSLLANLLVLLIFSLILSSILFIIYQIAATVYWGGSIGKRAFGLVVQDDNGKTIEIKQAALRFIVGYTVSKLVLGLGFFWIIKDEEHKGWHDQIAGTKVIEKEKGSFWGLALLVLLIGTVLLFWGGLFVKMSFILSL